VKLSVSILLFIASATAQAQSFSERVEAAMEASDRTAAETDRDANRKPVATLEFFGIDNGMKVLELIPGGGWYTKLLAPALRDNGELFVSVGTGRVKERLMGEPPFDKIQLIEPEGIELSRTEADGVPLNTVNSFSFDESGFDAALTFRNMHNFDAAGRANLNRAVFDALKPGGIYGVVDHTRRHMQEVTLENRRRADPVEIIKEVLEAGFEFVDYSNLHYKLDDELRYEVGRRSVTGNTDRFTLLFKKPN